MAVQRSSVVELYVSSLTQVLSDAAEEAAALAAFNKRKSLAAKSKDKGKRVAASDDDVDNASVPSRDTLVTEASRVLAFVPNNAPVDATDAAAVVSSSVEERSSSLKPFGAFDEFITNSTQVMPDPPNLFSPTVLLYTTMTYLHFACVSP